jgi:hypothetical protein
MNERIRQLDKQARHWAIDNTTFPISSHIPQGYTEKLAELIVKEMCGLMEQAEDDAYHCSEPADRPTEYIEWLVSWRTQFEEQFGVEE